MTTPSSPIPLNLNGGHAQSASDAFASVSSGGVTTGAFNAGGSGLGVNSGPTSITGLLVIGGVLITGLILWFKK